MRFVDRNGNTEHRNMFHIMTIIKLPIILRDTLISRIRRHDLEINLLQVNLDKICCSVGVNLVGKLYSEG